MRLLADTHALLWAVGAPERLSDAAREALSTTGHEVAIGTASLWEIAIKVSRGLAGRDRAAQALCENMILISKDSTFAEYPVEVLW